LSIDNTFFTIPITSIPNISTNTLFTMSYGSTFSDRQQARDLAEANNQYEAAGKQYASSASKPKKQYAESTFSTDTTATEKPLLGNSSSSSKRSSKAWNKTKTKTKKFLSTIGEPPTAEYDRQQAAKAKAEGKEPGQRPAYYEGWDFGPFNQRPSGLL
jgi:hypothetical protein